MQTITLLLTTPKGDELSRIPLTSWQIAGPGEAGSERPDLSGQIQNLEAAIRETVSGQGVALQFPDPLDFELAVSRSLLADDPEIFIPLVVHGVSGHAASSRPGGDWTPGLRGSDRGGKGDTPVPGSLDDLIADLLDLGERSGSGGPSVETYDPFEGEELFDAAEGRRGKGGKNHAW